MIRAIIFDVGGVILQSKVESVFIRLAEILKIDSKSLLELRQRHKQKMLTGAMPAEEFAFQIKQRFGLDTDVIQKWRDAYLGIMTIDTTMLRLVKNLGENYTLAVISNAPDLHAKINKERGIYSNFEVVLISSDIGLVKPQREIFQLALEKLKLKASECLFIDDREELLGIPKEMGFEVILFKNREQFVEELRNKGIMK